jgi:hypothetical protein
MSQQWTVKCRVPHTVILSAVDKNMPEWYHAIFDLIKGDNAVRYDWAAMRQSIPSNSWAQDALTKLVTTVGPTEEVVLAAIVKVLLVNKGVVRLRGAVQEKVEARPSV